MHHMFEDCCTIFNKTMIDMKVVLNGKARNTCKQIVFTYLKIFQLVFTGYNNDGLSVNCAIIENNFNNRENKRKLL